MSTLNITRIPQYLDPWFVEIEQIWDELETSVNDIETRLIAAEDAIALGGVTSISKSGDTQLTSDVTLTGSSGITLTQVGQNIDFSKDVPLTIAEGGTNSTSALANDKLIVSSGGQIVEGSQTASYYDATSSVQTQLNGKQATITGAASSVTTSDLSTSVVVVSDGSGKIASSAVTATTLTYLDASSSIQTQLNAKQDFPVWTAYTPTGSWVTNTTYTGFWRIIGDTMEVQIKIATSNAPTAAQLTVTIPPAYIMNTAKMVGPDADATPLGYGVARETGVGSTDVFVLYSDTSTLIIFTKRASATYVDATSLTNTIPFTFGATDFVTIKASFPVTAA